MFPGLKADKFQMVHVRQLRDLLDKIFILDPKKRITVDAALQHPFITSAGLGR